MKRACESIRSAVLEVKTMNIMSSAVVFAATTHSLLRKLSPKIRLELSFCLVVVASLGSSQILHVYYFLDRIFSLNGVELQTIFIASRSVVMVMLLSQMRQKSQQVPARQSQHPSTENCAQYWIILVIIILRLLLQRLHSSFLSDSQHSRNCHDFCLSHSLFLISSVSATSGIPSTFSLLVFELNIEQRNDFPYIFLFHMHQPLGSISIFFFGYFRGQGNTSNHGTPDCTSHSITHRFRYCEHEI